MSKPLNGPEDFVKEDGSHALVLDTGRQRVTLDAHQQQVDIVAGNFLMPKKRTVRGDFKSPPRRTRLSKKSTRSFSAAWLSSTRDGTSSA
jgi:hypothetical protein